MRKLSNRTVLRPDPILSWITAANQPRQSTQTPKIAPARDPPLWEAIMASELAGNTPEWDISAQPEPAFEFDQSIAW